MFLYIFNTNNIYFIYISYKNRYKIYIISVTTNIYQKAMPSMKKLSYF